MSVLDQFPHTVTIQERKGSRTASGGLDTSSGYSNVTGQVDVEAWVQKPKARTVEEWEKRGQTIAQVVFFPVDKSLTERHRIVFGTRKLEVVGYDDATAGLGFAFMAVTIEKKRRTT